MGTNIFTCKHDRLTVIRVASPANACIRETLPRTCIYVHAITIISPFGRFRKPLSIRLLIRYSRSPDIEHCAEIVSREFSLPVAALKRKSEDVRRNRIDLQVCILNWTREWIANWICSRCFVSRAQQFRVISIPLMAHRLLNINCELPFIIKFRCIFATFRSQNPKMDLIGNILYQSNLY